MINGSNGGIRSANPRNIAETSYGQKGRSSKILRSDTADSDPRPLSRLLSKQKKSTSPEDFSNDHDLRFSTNLNYNDASVFDQVQTPTANDVPKKRSKTKGCDSDFLAQAVDLQQNSNQGQYQEYKTSVGSFGRVNNPLSQFHAPSVHNARSREPDSQPTVDTHSKTYRSATWNYDTQRTHQPSSVPTAKPNETKDQSIPALRFLKHNNKRQGTIPIWTLIHFSPFSFIYIFFAFPFR